MRMSASQIQQLQRKLVREMVERKALLELLINKGLISSAEYEAQVEATLREALAKNPQLEAGDFSPGEVE